GGHDQEQAQPLHGLDRFSASELRADLREAQRDAEPDSEADVVSQEKYDEKQDGRRQVEEYQCRRVQKQSHRTLNSASLSRLAPALSHGNINTGFACRRGW